MSLLVASAVSTLIRNTEYAFSTLNAQAGHDIFTMCSSGIAFDKLCNECTVI